MELLKIITIIFVCLVNAYFSYLLIKYNKLLKTNHENFKQMHDLTEKYRKMWEKQRDHNKAMTLSEQFKSKTNDH